MQIRQNQITHTPVDRSTDARYALAMTNEVGFRDDGTGVRRWWDGEKFTDWASKEDIRPARPTPAKARHCFGVILDGDTVSYENQGGPVKGAVATVEAGADIKSRVTATRLVALGVFALAAPKRTGHVYLTIEHPDYFIQVPIKLNMEGYARSFAAAVNQAARR